MKDAIELFLDGLDAAIDGRGFGEERQRAHDYVVRAVNSHAEMLAMLRALRNSNTVPEMYEIKLDAIIDKAEGR